MNNNDSSGGHVPPRRIAEGDIIDLVIDLMRRVEDLEAKINTT